jgi:subtilisin family serine protease
MSCQFRGPGVFVACTTLAVVFLCGLQLSSESATQTRVIARLNGADAVEGEVLLKYRDDRVRARHSAIETAADADTVESIDRRGVHLLRSKSLATSELLALLVHDPDVEYAEPNYVVRALGVPNDPSFASLWGLFNNGLNPVGAGGLAGADIDAPGAWDIATGSRASVIGVIDTGIDYTHPDLAANMWTAPAPFQVTIGGQTINCAAGTRGFNAVARNCDPMDDHSHGTHVAGTIGARGNNAAGVTGVNWIASMMAIKVLGSSGTGTVSDVVAGLEFAVQAKAAFASTNGARIRVLSNSWASGAPSASLQNAINAANGADMLLVTAAGNSGTSNDAAPVYPASYALPNVVTVASSTSADQRSPFSNYGAASVHLAAPGSAILSTAPGNAYAISQGTSMATAHVSGAALLALSMCTLTTPELKSLLLDSADRVPAFSGITATGGRLNVRAALQDCPRPNVTAVTLTSDLASPQPAGKTVTWTAVADGGEGPYSYRWSVEVSPGVFTNSAWGASNTFAWTPTDVNASYRVLVGVRSAWNTGAAELWAVKPYSIQPGVTSATLTPNVAAPQNPGTTVTWTAAAAGGQAPYQYQFAVWDGVAWTITRPWATSNTYAWTPAVADPDYRVLVQVRSAWNAGAGELTVSNPFAIGTVVTSLSLTPSVAAPGAVGRAATFTAVASGGQAPYQYQWSVWNGSWTVVGTWSASNVFTWTPSVANSTNRVKVAVRSAWNTGPVERESVVDYAIMPSVTGATLTPNVASPRVLGATVRWQASASGGQGPYQYQWAVFDGVTWANLTTWTTSSTFDWTPPAAGDSYRIAVRVRSAWNTGAAEFTALQSYVVTLVDTRTAMVVFQPPTPAGTVSYYRLEVFASNADPRTANPIATQNLGLPPVVSGESSVDVRATILPLPPGNYIATVAAVGPQGTGRSLPFNFTR